LQVQHLFETQHVNATPEVTPVLTLTPQDAENPENEVKSEAMRLIESYRDSEKDELEEIKLYESEIAQIDELAILEEIPVDNRTQEQMAEIDRIVPIREAHEHFYATLHAR
jgi:FMN-dependent NADH-azoreductase